MSPSPALTPYNYVFETSEFPLAVKPQFSVSEPSPHTHERFHEIVLVVAGHAIHTYERCQYRLEPREIFVIPPGLQHGYNHSENFDYYNILVDFKQLKLPLYDLVNTAGWQDLFVMGPHSHLLEKRQPLRKELDFNRFDYCVELLEQMNKLQGMREAGYRMAMLTRFADFLRVACCAGEASAPHTNDNPANIPVVIGNIATVLARFCDDDWPIERLLRDFHLSRTVLFREFHKYYQMSPIRFLNRQRLRKAASLLTSSDAPLEAIAIQCGFANGSYFATAFARHFGVTPLKFRRHPEFFLLQRTKCDMSCNPPHDTAAVGDAEENIRE